METTDRTVPSGYRSEADWSAVQKLAVNLTITKQLSWTAGGAIGPVGSNINSNQKKILKNTMEELRFMQSLCRI